MRVHTSAASAIFQILAVSCGGNRPSVDAPTDPTHPNRDTGGFGRRQRSSCCAGAYTWAYHRPGTEWLGEGSQNSVGRVARFSPEGSSRLAVSLRRGCVYTSGEGRLLASCFCCASSSSSSIKDLFDTCDSREKKMVGHVKSILSSEVDESHPLHRRLWSRRRESPSLVAIPFLLPRHGAALRIRLS